MLLRLEKFPHRMNFSRGILESRKQTYKHLKMLLKPIPLETPTMIELSPGNSICVTLFDANHCSGAAMFLIEGQGKAILYTGDVRSEEWWIQNLVRHSKFVLYASGLRKLDTIYLDTTFASNIERRQSFQSKAEGLRELLEKVDAYPEDTVFYFNAWTFGYEDVWLALSQFLNSQVHLDRYRYGIYTSVSKNNGAALECPEAPVLCGFRCGNTDQPGILTRNQTVRLHSCERNTGCPIWDPENATGIVTITPIIARQGNIEVREAGAGGGHGDLNQIHELDLTDMIAVQQLFYLCLTKIKDESVLGKIVKMLQAEIDAKRKGIQLEADDEDSKLDLENIPIDELPDMLAEMAKNGPRTKKEEDEVEVKPAVPPTLTTSTLDHRPLPRQITFPYSRHSSHSELRSLVAAFKPRDVWPNTFSKPQYFNESDSMENLFGDLCDRRPGQQMAFDREMRAAVADCQRSSRKRKRGLNDDDAQKREQMQSQTDEDSDEEVEEDLEQMSPEKLDQGDARPQSSAVRPPISMSQTRPTETEHVACTVTVDTVHPENLITSTLSSGTNHASEMSTKLFGKPPASHGSPAHVAAPPSAKAIIKTTNDVNSPRNLAIQGASDDKPAKTLTSNIQVTSFPTTQTTLDDRIATAFLADNISLSPPRHHLRSAAAAPAAAADSSHPHSHSLQFPIPPHSARRSSFPSSSALPSSTSTSAKARLATRKAAFEAARSGAWSDRIRLVSVVESSSSSSSSSTVTARRKRDGLESGGGDGEENVKVGKEVDGFDLGVEDAVGEDDVEEEEEEEEEEEKDVLDAARWGE